MYPLEKYRYVVAGNRVIAITTYASQTIRGVAICCDDDVFDLEKGKELAAARCAVKVAQKRLARAENKMLESDEACARANEHNKKMEQYYFDSQNALVEANLFLDKVIEEI